MLTYAKCSGRVNAFQKLKMFSVDSLYVETCDGIFPLFSLQINVYIGTVRS